MVSPTPIEWLVIYAPLIIIMIVVMIVEVRTSRIPNVIVYPTFVYLLAARSVIGPAPLWDYLVSVAVIAFVYIGIGFSSGYLGGGGAKFGVAVAAALVPWMAFVVAGVSLLGGGTLWLVNKKSDCVELRLPGSVVISALVTGVVVLTVLHTDFQLF